MRTRSRSAPAQPARPEPRQASVSTRRKITKRRDVDAVRVYPDGRLAYWTGGKAGVGARKFERCGYMAIAEKRAGDLRHRFQSRQFGAAPRPDATLDDLVQSLLDHIRSEEHRVGKECRSR